MCFVNCCCCKANFTQNFGTHIAKSREWTGAGTCFVPGPVRSSFGPAGPGTMPEPDRTLARTHHDRRTGRYRRLRGPTKVWQGPGHFQRVHSGSSGKDLG